MKNVTLVILAAMTTACSTEPLRTKFSDHTMRIMLDPASIDVDNYVKIQSALVESDNWAIIDRSSGFAAIAREQQMLHRSASDRFEDREKFAHWGELYGIGAVVVGHNQCSTHFPSGGLFDMSVKTKCHQYLNLVDANTGEVIVAVEDQNNGSDWHDIVEKLNNAYPKSFKVFHENQVLSQYKMQSQEAALRQKEVLVQQDAFKKGEFIK